MSPFNVVLQFLTDFEDGVSIAREEDIGFVHFRSLPDRESFSRVEEGLSTMAGFDNCAAILVTLPQEHLPINSAPQRYAFENLVVDTGGQLTFVDYSPFEKSETGRKAAEAAYRRLLLKSLEKDSEEV